MRWLVVLALASGCSHQTRMHLNRISTGGAVIVTSCDWGQTAVSTGLPRQMYVETNPMLGRFPSEPRVAVYFLAVIGATIAAARWLPDWAVPIVDGVAIAAGASSVWHNTEVGMSACGIAGDPARAP